ncbi:hypothetical protein RhiLY_03591 [Ceratobasidium sp. AG-Ba]|nr:hypothetical protein RhiLY_03591 [Ceratobasidium sp. AG-Ba]
MSGNTILVEVDEWLAWLKPRYMDLVGDYAGDEFFVIDGDSLSCPKIEAEPGAGCRRGSGLRLRSMLWAGYSTPNCDGHRSNDPDNEPPAREDSDEDMADNFAPAPAPPRSHSPLALDPDLLQLALILGLVLGLSLSLRLGLCLGLGPILCPDIRLRVIDANEDALFYQNLLHENRVNRLPPLNVHRDNELDIQIQPHDEVQADGEANQSGDEAPDQNIDIPGEPGGEPAQPINHAEIFVPPPDLGGDPEPPDEEDRYAAFGEHPTLRNIYFRTWIRAAFYGATHDDIQATLESHKLSLESLTHIAPLPDDFLENIGKMPRTLRSLERRIGMDFSGLLTVYVLCPDCGKRYSPEHFANLHGPQCVQHHAGVQCEGIVYKIVDLADGTRKRNPFRTYPYIHLPAALGRLLSRPGMAELMQHWRSEGDEPNEEAEPLRWQDWVNQTPPDRRFGDMSKAWGWRAQMAGLEQTYNGETYGDDPVGDHPLSLLRQHIGLSLGLNMDGCVRYSFAFILN